MSRDEVKVILNLFFHFKRKMSSSGPIWFPSLSCACDRWYVSKCVGSGFLVFFLQSSYLGVLAQIVDCFMPPLSLTFKRTRFISTFKASTRFKSQNIKNSVDGVQRAIYHKNRTCIRSSEPPVTPACKSWSWTNTAVLITSNKTNTDANISQPTTTIPCHNATLDSQLQGT